MKLLFRVPLLFAAALALAQAPAPGADAPVIRLPEPPAPAPQPMPPIPGPAPAPVLRLTADTYYVIDSDVPVVVTSSPLGLVTGTDTPEAGPLKFKGRFVDGTGRSESRTFKGKFVYTIEPVKSGRCELLVFPEGAKTAADVVRRTLDVDAGEGPRPPPKPDPDPTPDPAPGPTAAKVAVVILEETLQRTPAQGKVILDKPTRDWLAAGGHTIDTVDISDPAAVKAGYKPYADAIGLPAVLVFDQAATGPAVPLAKFKLPATGADLKSQIGKAVRP